MASNSERVESVPHSVQFFGGNPWQRNGGQGNETGTESNKKFSRSQGNAGQRNFTEMVPGLYSPAIHSPALSRPPPAEEDGRWKVEDGKNAETRSARRGAARIHPEGMKSFSPALPRRRSGYAGYDRAKWPLNSERVESNGRFIPTIRLVSNDAPWRHL